MSTFDDNFAECARPLLRDQLGDAVTYTDENGDDTATTAIVGEEWTEEDQDEQGRKHRRAREVTLFADSIASVSMKGKVTISGEVWAIDEILAETPTETLVRAVRIERTEVSRPDYRQPQ